MSLTVPVPDNVNSSAVLAPSLNGFQLVGILPGAATSDVLITPGSFLITAEVEALVSVRSPAIKELP